MIKLFRYQYLSFQRSTYWQKSILLNILLAIIGIYLLLNIVVIGLYVDGLIQIVYGLSDTISLLSGFLLFYFLLDFFARFLMQNTRLPDLLPFLILPISKRKLIHYALGKTLFSIFNLLAACFFVPYFIKVVLLNRSLTFSIGWLASVLILVFINNFLAVSLKRQYVRYPLFIAITIITFGMLLYINHSALLNLTGYFASLLIWLACQPWRVVFPLMLLFLSYFVAYQSMHKQLYLEDHENKSTKGYIESSHFSKRRQIVNLVVLELKMIWRNKRPKTSILTGLFFIVYGGFLYLQNSDSGLFSLMISLFIIASLPLIYGQTVFSWESSYFGFFLTNKFNYMDFLKSKYLVFAFLTSISYILTLPLILWQSELFIIHTAWLFYLIGIVSIMILLLGCYKEKRISLDRGITMNFEGLSMVEFIIGIPSILLPLLLYYGLSIFDLADYTIYIIGALGALALLLHPVLLQRVLRLFEKRKYKMAQGFKTN